MSEVIALSSCKGCVHVFVCRYRNSVGGKNCTHKRMSKDVRPVVRGRWIRTSSEIGTIDVEHCSVCGCEMNERNQFWNALFCPNCGAEMKLG